MMKIQMHFALSNWNNATSNSIVNDIRKTSLSQKQNRKYKIQTNDQRWKGPFLIEAGENSF